MADLLVTYSKTPKGLRARSSLIGGLSGKLMKVLSFIDGVSKAQTILTKHDDISADKLLDALAKLEIEGYIKPAVVSVSDDDWDFGDSPKKIVVEELTVAKAAKLAAQVPNKDAERLEAERLKEEAEKVKQPEQAKKPIPPKITITAIVLIAFVN